MKHSQDTDGNNLKTKKPVYFCLWHLSSHLPDWVYSPVMKTMKTDLHRFVIVQSSENSANLPACMTLKQGSVRWATLPMWAFNQLTEALLVHKHNWSHAVTPGLLLDLCLLRAALKVLLILLQNNVKLSLIWFQYEHRWDDGFYWFLPWKQYVLFLFIIIFSFLNCIRA